MILTCSGRGCPVLISTALLALLAAAPACSSGSINGSGGGAGTGTGGARDAGAADQPRDTASDAAGGRAGQAGSGGVTGGGGVIGGGGVTGGGGSGNGGAGRGSGGNMGPAVLYGYKPTTYSPADALAAYNAWKTVHLENCNDGKYRVKWEDGRPDGTVSEGIAYGMLLTVAYNDQPAFDGLLAYYKAAAQPNHLMNWLRYGCDAHREIKYGLDYPDGAASDADLDAAMALIMANCRWGGGSYASEATTLINAIRSNETITENGGRYVLLPGDSQWFHDFGGSCINPSYSAPGYYRAFANFMTAQGDKDFWNKLASDTYSTLGSGQSSSSGLVRNWATSAGAGNACAGNSFKCPNAFGDDAVRTPWRIATDYVWFGKAEAKSFVDKMTVWAKNTAGIASLNTWYNLDGTAISPGCTASGRIISVGSFACAAMAYDQVTVSAFAAEMKKITDPNYFERSLRAIYSLMLTGQFTMCGNKP